MAMKWAWDSEEEQKRQDQKRIANEIRRKGKPVSAAAIERQLSASEAEAAKKKLGDTSTATNIDGTTGNLSLDDIRTATQTFHTYYTWPSIPIRWSMDWGFTPKQPDLPEETIVAAVPAWRLWRAPIFGKTLHSNYRAETLWPIRKKLEKECERNECLGAYCTCGIYAWKSQELLGKYEEAEQLDRLRCIKGEVWLWGRVLECENGYRAQYAYPKAFMNTGALAQQYAEIYGVPLIK